MYFFTILLVQTVFYSKILDATPRDMNNDLENFNYSDVKLLEEKNRATFESKESECFHIILTNRHQDVIDDISLVMPDFKVILEEHMKLIKPIFEDSMQESIKEKLKKLKNKYIQCCSQLNILIENEISDLDENLIGLKFSDPYFISLLHKIKGGRENETTLTSKEERIKLIQESIKGEEFKKFLLAEVYLGFSEKMNGFLSSSSKRKEECANAEIGTFPSIIKNFLVKLKNRIKSSTHALFNIYKVQDSVFKDIFSEFAKKYGLEDSILHDNDPSD
ncbi:hypothetical protein CWI38_1312p0010 [Hamiltosporidium tvaerminnensis]|uniref:Uncharacterized protein n=1 Tax=Hamiltosporidium tvaerminnensis TaxID=1176355 RepID=A0A4Q9LTZ9_9MICR|nr:hypothetical protein CWI38_1312p0010 [Hamiltosporidium tvaerminnensis]